MDNRVDVFSFKTWDRKSSDWVVPPYKLTVEGIISVSGMIIEGTGEEVSEEDLNHQGRYLPHEQDLPS